MEGSEQLDLNEMVSSYNNSFRVGDINLQKIAEPLQESITASLATMAAYKADVTAAVAEIKALEERDRLLAEQQAKENEKK